MLTVKKAICEGGYKHQVLIRMARSNEVLNRQVCVLLSLDKVVMEHRM